MYISDLVICAMLYLYTLLSAVTLKLLDGGSEGPKHVGDEL
jgi:hypothetical protein